MRSMAKFDEAVKASKGHTGMITEAQAAENERAPFKARDILIDEALPALEKVNDSVDGYEFSLAIKQAAETVMSGDKAGFAKQIGKIREAMLELQNDYRRYPAAVARIQFVVQYFVAVNSPGFKGLPSADEIKKFKGTLTGTLSSDFKLVFKSSGVMSPFGFFVAYADVLDLQLAMLDKMSAAGKAAKTPIPTQGEAEAFFETLKKSTNAEVREAYEQYAAGFFYHRGVASLQDMNQTGVADLYKRNLSIAGTRPLVCSGYAILGAHLLEKAGAKVVRFTTAVLATDDDIVNDTIADGHAIVLLSRNKEEFVVSNDSTYGTEKEAFNSVWPTRKATEFHQATGKTNPDALKNLRDSLGKKSEAIKASRAKAGKKK